MGKVGRNELCPCNSGKKYKHCCLPLHQSGRALQQEKQSPQVSLQWEVEAIQEAAKNKVKRIREMGVFILYSTQEGDAWLLEITDSDAVQLATGGTPVENLIEENPETIEIDWSHRFAVENRELVLKPYKVGEIITFNQEVTKQLSASMRRIRKKCSPELLNSVHLDNPEVDKSAVS